LQTELEKKPLQRPKKRKSYPERQLDIMLKGQSLELPETHHQIIIGDGRQMAELKDSSVHLIVTSPPYPMIELWDDLFLSVGCDSFDAMHVYLAEVWQECYRVVVDGGIACINVGDALRKLNSNFQLFPNHVKIIEHCETIGFTTLPYILWKKPTKRPNAFLGSGLIPPNAYITQDCEYILIFRKGHPRPFPPKDLLRYASYYTLTERNAWFTQIWQLPGARQENDHISRRIAAFPEEVAYRLIRMFSVIGDTVVDPFLGSGTTTKVAMENHRNSLGYEIDSKLIPTLKDRFAIDEDQHRFVDNVSVKTLTITRRKDSF